MTLSYNYVSKVTFSGLTLHGARFGQFGAARGWHAGPGQAGAYLSGADSPFNKFTCTGSGQSNLECEHEGHVGPKGEGESAFAAEPGGPAPGSGFFFPPWYLLEVFGSAAHTLAPMVAKPPHLIGAYLLAPRLEDQFGLSQAVWPSSAVSPISGRR